MENPALPRSPEELTEVHRSLRMSRDIDPYSRWLQLIKELRARHNVSILEAERIALSNRHRRRWVEKQINTHRQCRKHALSHIRHNGAASLINREPDTFNFSIP
ncbi:MAG TPA: hypothetical protein VL094_03325 [Sphingomonadaceae bacterium]|nr:hypothetical protein [Sphingomonadaceae bacterium]